MSREKNNFNFPPSDEFENVVNRIDNDDRRTNFGLNHESNSIDKIKYKICKSILSYKLKNKLTIEEISDIINVNNDIVEKILYSHIDEFDVNQLLKYASELKVNFELKIIDEKFYG